MTRYALLHALALILGVATASEIGMAAGLFVWFGLGLLIDSKKGARRQ